MLRGWYIMLLRQSLRCSRMALQDLKEESLLCSTTRCDFLKRDKDFVSRVSFFFLKVRSQFVALVLSRVHMLRTLCHPFFKGNVHKWRPTIFDYFWSSYLPCPTIFTLYYPIFSWLFLTHLPTLKSEIINGRSLNAATAPLRLAVVCYGWLSLWKCSSTKK